MDCIFSLPLLAFSILTTQSALPVAVVSKKNILKSGMSCRTRANVPKKVYFSRLCRIYALRSFLLNPSNLKYLQWCKGPARYPVRMRKTGTPAYGIRFNGRRIMNSMICRKLNGLYTEDIVGLPNFLTASS